MYLIKYIYGQLKTNVAKENEVAKDISKENFVNELDSRKTEPKPVTEPKAVTEPNAFEEDNALSENLEELRANFPDIILKNHRDVLCRVDSVEENSLMVDADFRKFILDLSSIRSECPHEVGDRVYVKCYAENEEGYCGEISETLEPYAVVPATKKKGQKFRVKEVRPDHTILNNECYISKDVLKKCDGMHLNEGEDIYADIIECRYENFKWRCISFTPLKTNELEELVRVPRNGVKQKKLEADATQNIVLPKPCGRWQTYQSRLCEYANQVWSQEMGEVIEGSPIHTKRRFKVRIPQYEVPYNIRINYLTLYDKPRLCQETIKRLHPSVGQDLAFDNYLDRFTTLLWLDEIELYKNFRMYDIDRVEFNVESEYLSVTIMNLGERRPSMMIGDRVYAFPIKTENNDDTTSTVKPPCFLGFVHSILYDKVLLKFHKMFHDNYSGESYRLEFHFSRMNKRRLHYAVNRAVQILGKDFLFPKEIRYRQCPQLDIRMDLKEGIMSTATHSIKWYNPNLNHLQRSAVFNILRAEAENTPYIIYGPPGTGKTLTIIECILQLVANLPHARLLVGTPSNSAADLICSRLIESKTVHMGEMIRLVSFNSIERDKIPENLLPYCATADLGEDGTYPEECFVTGEGIQINCPKRKLVHYRITVGTCSTLGKYLELGFSDDQFTHVLIDEAGQCTEPEIMVPLCQVAKNRGQVILAGDPMQLKPIVISKYADDDGLSVSFLERIMDTAPYKKDNFDFDDFKGYNPVLITKLCENYRALPSILRIYNYLFYDLELRANISAENSPESELLKKLNNKILFPSKKRLPTHGAFFYEVRGENMRDNDSPSWCNPREANVVFNMTLALYRAGVKPDDIGIIAPYTKQVKLIRNFFVQAKLINPKIGSVEEFQGLERNVILLSTVRTAKREVLNYDWRFGLGFVKSERRLNVAISRARALLIVFGDRGLLGLDDCWGVFIEDCCNNESFYGQDNRSETEGTNTGKDDGACEDAQATK